MIVDRAREDARAIPAYPPRGHTGQERCLPAAQVPSHPATLSTHLQPRETTLETRRQGVQPRSSLRTAPRHRATSRALTLGTATALLPAMLTKTNPVTYALPGETLADLHADHDPLSPISLLVLSSEGDGALCLPRALSCPDAYRRTLRSLVSADDLRDTRATLLCTLLAVDSWGL